MPVKIDSRLSQTAKMNWNFFKSLNSFLMIRQTLRLCRSRLDLIHDYVVLIFLIVIDTYHMCCECHRRISLCFILTLNYTTN